MTVVGLDLSLACTGLVAIDGDKVDSLAIKTKPQEHVRRVVKINAEILATLKKLKPELIVIEDYAFMGNGKITELAELGGVVKTSLFSLGYKFVTVAPSQVKKFACGKGNAKKDQVRLEVYKRWGFEAPTNDEVDAYALARIGLGVLGLDDNLTKPQLEVIKAIKEDK